MKNSLSRRCQAILAAAIVASVGTAWGVAGDETKDPQTGARLVCLSHDAAAPSGVIYFTQECVTPDSRYALIRDLDIDAGHTAGTMWRYDFQTKECIKVTEMVTKNQVLAAKSGNLYFSSADDHAIYKTNIMTKETTKVGDMPKGILMGSGVTVNLDESLIVGTAGMAPAEETVKKPASGMQPNQGSGFDATFARHDLNILFSMDAKTGQYTELHHINTWLGHPQFSPADAKLVMYCHEGPWDKVDRIWTLKIGENEPHKVLTRTQPPEIGGHEFFSSDGQMTFFDHSFNRKDPKAPHYLTGVSVTNYNIKPDFGSIHYVQSPDGKFFVGDGGIRKDPSTQGMFLLVPQGSDFKSIKICSMAKHAYPDSKKKELSLKNAAEPNPHITPDQHWVLFSGAFDGKEAQAYAVELPKEFWK